MSDTVNNEEKAITPFEKVFAEFKASPKRNYLQLLLAYLEGHIPECRRDLAAIRDLMETEYKLNTVSRVVPAGVHCGDFSASHAHVSVSKECVQVQASYPVLADIYALMSTTRKADVRPVFKHWLAQTAEHYAKLKKQPEKPRTNVPVPRPIIHAAKCNESFLTKMMLCATAHAGKWDTMEAMSAFLHALQLCEDTGFKIAGWRPVDMDVRPLEEHNYVLSFWSKEESVWQRALADGLYTTSGFVTIVNRVMTEQTKTGLIAVSFSEDEIHPLLQRPSPSTGDTHEASETPGA